MSGGGAKDTSTARPVFGLSEEELRPIVNSIACEPVASFSVNIEHEVRYRTSFRCWNVARISNDPHILPFLGLQGVFVGRYKVEFVAHT